MTTKQIMAIILLFLLSELRFPVSTLALTFDDLQTYMRQNDGVSEPKQ